MKYIHDSLLSYNSYPNKHLTIPTPNTMSLTKQEQPGKLLEWTVIAPPPLTGYLKTPALRAHGGTLSEDADATIVLKREINVCEFLRQYPHPNICGYQGVVLGHRNYFQGLAFDKYEMDLHTLVAEGHMFSADKCLSDIEAGIDHFRALGIVYCDIKPRNVFVS